MVTVVGIMIAATAAAAARRADDANCLIAAVNKPAVTTCRTAWLWHVGHSGCGPAASLIGRGL
jgi:hypothetical protein